MANIIHVGTCASPGGSVTYVQQAKQWLDNPLYGTDDSEPRYKTGYTESTGCKTVRVYTGLYSDMVALAASLFGAAGEQGSTQTTWEAASTEGPMGELRVTTEEFRIPIDNSNPSSGSGDGGGGGGGGSTSSSGDTPGESPDYPEVSIQAQTVEEPIFLHPKFADIDDEALTGLRMMMNGASEEELVTLVDGKKTTVGKLAAREPKLKKLIKKGITHYLMPHTVVNIRHKGRNPGGEAGKCGHISGLPKAAAGLRWMCIGTGIEKCGPEVYSTSVWELGIWPKEIYD